MVRDESEAITLNLVIKKTHNYKTIRVSGKLGFVRSPIHLEELHQRVLVEMTLREALCNLQDGLFLGRSHGDETSSL